MAYKDRCVAPHVQTWAAIKNSRREVRYGEAASTAIFAAAIVGAYAFTYLTIAAIGYILWGG